MLNDGAQRHYTPHACVLPQPASIGDWTSAIAMVNGVLAHTNCEETSAAGASDAAIGGPPQSCVATPSKCMGTTPVGNAAALAS